MRFTQAITLSGQVQSSHAAGNQRQYRRHSVTGTTRYMCRDFRIDPLLDRIDGAGRG